MVVCRLGTAGADQSQSDWRPSRSGLASGGARTIDAENPADAQTELRRRQARARGGPITVAATTGLFAPTLFFQRAMGVKGITVRRNLLIFGIGMGLAIVTGWTAFPRALYV